MRVLLNDYELLTIFKTMMVDALAPYCSFDHAIDLKEDNQLPWGLSL
jgi:hypothetical protein